MGAAALMLGNGPLQSLGARAALGQGMPSVTGYGPLVPKTDGQNRHFLPAEFNFQTIDRQGLPMRDGRPTPRAAPSPNRSARPDRGPISHETGGDDEPGP
jgi:hypothetical protein